ncbi:hypothetical protein DEU56DRAFT_979693 [Suillus clintonianus]|nr:uncharacterized protein DEU56DRAFT_979693 [Suillus clintonianus]KAG2141879.1 hypothetical protein DEU56DRAFT_979693 [Suillus clintonianus]
MLIPSDVASCEAYLRVQLGTKALDGLFQGMHGHSQISRPLPQQRPGRFKKLRLAVTRRSLPPPAHAPTLTSPTALPPVAAPVNTKRVDQRPITKVV